ncbi:hypothetical protein MMC32_007469 [Xylographa parallela]|nr:hypothetical protein [Xylographa parallela]
MDPNSTKELGFPDYWNNRYNQGAESDHATHEWFRTFEKLRPFLEKELPRASSEPRILHLGCGDSTLPADLANLHYHNQLAVDFSDVVITQMRARHPHLEWRVADVRHLSLDDASIDIAIDKASQGTLDAMLYGSQWDPPAAVRANVRAYVDEVARVLKPGGRWLYVTFRQPHFVRPQVEREGVWEVGVERLADGPGMFDDVKRRSYGTRGTSSTAFGFGKHDILCPRNVGFFSNVVTHHTQGRDCSRQPWLECAVYTFQTTVSQKAVQELLNCRSRKAGVKQLNCRSRKAGVKQLLHDSGDPLTCTVTRGHRTTIRLLRLTAQTDGQLRSVDNVHGASVPDLATKGGYVQAMGAR